VRITRGEFHQANAPQFLLSARLGALRLPSLQLERQGSISQHVAPGNQGRFLKNKPTRNGALLRLDRQSAGIRPIESRREPQQR